MGGLKKEVGKEMFYTQSAMSEFFTGGVRVRRQMNEHTAAAYIIWLGIGQNSALAATFRQKIFSPDTPIRDDDFARILEQRYLFQRHIDLDMPYFVTRRDMQILTQIGKARNMGRLFITLQDAHNLTITKLSDDARVTRQSYIKLRQNRNYPNEITVVRLLAALGYDIHHPITQYTLQKLQEWK